MESEDYKRKKRERRTWTDEQDDTLKNILEDVVVNGYARKNGTFKAGTSTLIENALLDKFPNSGFKYSPHVESKIKDFKKKYAWSMICSRKADLDGMMRESVWKLTTMKHGMHMPSTIVMLMGGGANPVHVMRPSLIYLVDRAIRKAAKVLAKISNEVNEELVKLEKDGVLGSRIKLNQQSTTKSESTTKDESAVTRKRRKGDNDDNITRGLDKFVATFKEVMETSNEQIRLLVEYFQPKVSKKDEVKARKDELWTELLKLDLSVKDRIKALKILMSDDADLFLALDTEEEKMEFVMQII